MFGDGEQRVVQVGVAGETFGAGDEVKIELVPDAAEVADQFVLEALGVIDEVARMHLKKSREQESRGIGEVGAGAALDLGEVALADALAGFLLDEAGEFGLRELTIETA